MTKRNVLVIRGLVIRGLAVEHHACFLLLGALSLILLWAPLTMLVKLSLQDERYSHILIVPLISLAFLYVERKKIFFGLHFSPLQSAPLLALGIIAFSIAGASSSLDQSLRLSLTVCALISTWLAAFVFCYGVRCFRAALFPLLFLALMIPVPIAALDYVVFLLQKGSAAVAYVLFKLLGVPVFWSGGFKFALPGVEIEIAKECSGIRSTTALFITGILASHVFLRSGWRKILLSLLTIPIAIFRNAVRIVTISWLGVYVDQGFLFGKLHRYGGVPFALISLAILGPALWILQRTEANSRNRKGREMSDQTYNEGTAVMESRP